MQFKQKRDWYTFTLKFKTKRFYYLVLELTRELS